MAPATDVTDPTRAPEGTGTAPDAAAADTATPEARATAAPAIAAPGSTGSGPAALGSAATGPASVVGSPSPPALRTDAGGDGSALGFALPPGYEAREVDPSSPSRLRGVAQATLVLVCGALGWFAGGHLTAVQLALVVAGLVGIGMIAWAVLSTLSS